MPRRNAPIPFRPVRQPTLPAAVGEEVAVTVDVHAYRVRLVVGGEPLLFDPHEAIEVGCSMIRASLKLLELTRGTAEESAT